VASCLAQLANYYYKVGRLDKSASCAHSSLSTYQQIGDRRGEASALVCLGNVWCPVSPGTTENASTYDFPVYIKPIEVGTEVVSSKHDPAILKHTIEAGKELVEKMGCRAIVGACGYFANYQEKVADALDVPVFLSSLMQVPIVIRALKPDQKVGIICANEDALSAAPALKQCGVDDLSRIVIAGAQDTSQIQLAFTDTGHMNNAKLGQELTDVAKRMVSGHPDVGAILLEGSLFPPYAWEIQKAVRLPVFDYSTMVNWVYSAVIRRPFAGFI